MTEISIVIPAHNSAKTIEKTLDSIYNQTINNFEVLIIENGSDDNTLEVIKDYIKNYQINNINLITTDIANVSNARNIGIEKANSELIYFIDSDDIIDKFCLEKLIKNIKDVDFAFCGFNRVDDNMNVVMKYKTMFKYYNNIVNNISILNDYLKGKIWFCTGSCIFKKSIIKQFNIKFDTSYSGGEDQEFYIKYLINSKKALSINEELFYYIQSENSLSNSKNVFDAIIVFENILKYIKGNQNFKSIYLIIKNYKIPYLIMRGYFKLARNKDYKDFIDFYSNDDSYKIPKIKKIPLTIQGLFLFFSIILFKISSKLFYKISNIKNRRNHIES